MVFPNFPATLNYIAVISDQSISTLTVLSKAEIIPHSKLEIEPVTFLGTCKKVPAIFRYH